MDFDERRRAKWRRGRRERGLDDDAPFDGDPARELQDETLDIPNYAEELLRRGDIGRAEAERLHAMSLDIYLFMNAVRERRALPLGVGARLAPVDTAEVLADICSR